MQIECFAHSMQIECFGISLMKIGSIAHNFNVTELLVAFPKATCLIWISYTNSQQKYRCYQINFEKFRYCQRAKIGFDETGIIAIGCSLRHGKIFINNRYRTTHIIHLIFSPDRYILLCPKNSETFQFKLTGIGISDNSLTQRKYQQQK